MAFHRLRGQAFPIDMTIIHGAVQQKPNYERLAETRFVSSPGARQDISDVLGAR